MKKEITLSKAKACTPSCCLSSMDPAERCDPKLVSGASDHERHSTEMHASADREE